MIPILLTIEMNQSPLRIGEATQGGQQISGSSTDCGMDFFDDDGKIIQHNQSVKNQRPGKEGDLAFVFSSLIHGDPCTPILEAYEGEEVQIRLIQGAQEVQHMFTIEGQTWPRIIDYDIDKDEQISADEARELAKVDNSKLLITAQEVGISEHFEIPMSFFNTIDVSRILPKLSLPKVFEGDLLGDLVDHLYHLGTVDSQWNGAWGLIRVYGKRQEGLVPLPKLREFTGYETARFFKGNEELSSKGDLCNKKVVFSIAATQINLLRNDPSSENPTQFYDADNKIYDPDGLIFLQIPSDAKQPPTFESLRELYKSKDGNFEPLVLRANAGSCISIKLYNFLNPYIYGGIRNLEFLPDEKGDALMPKIVPLNVDQKEEVADANDVDDVRPSSYLSISIPLPPILPTNDQFETPTSNSLFVGKNQENPPLSVSSPITAEPNSQFENYQLLEFYAGITSIKPKQNDDGNFHKVTYQPYAYGTLPIKSFGDVIGHGVHGLFGTLIIEPEGATYYDPDDLDNFKTNNSNSRNLDKICKRLSNLKGSKNWKAIPPKGGDELGSKSHNLLPRCRRQAT